MPDEPNGVVVSYKEMFDELRRLVEGLGTLTQELKESRKTDDDHEARIRFLERLMWAIPLTAFTALGAFIMKLIP